MDDLGQFTQTFLGILKTRITQEKLPLPLPSSVVDRIHGVVRDSTKGETEMGEVVASDPILAAQVLVAAGNGKAGRAKQVTALPDTVSRLGAATLRRLLKEAAVHEVFHSRVPGANDALSRLSRHSKAVALLAREVAGLAGFPDADVAYLAGLLHDIEQLVVAVYLMEIEKALVKQPSFAWPEWLDYHAWLEVLNETREEIGDALVSKWNLPDALKQAITGIQDFDVANRVSLGNLVHFANAMATRAGICLEETDADEVEAVLMVGCSFLGLQKEMVDRMVNDIEERV
jgi:HD-like signal output (HDOD) protein